MPAILIVVALAAIIGLGGYFLSKDEAPVATTPAPVATKTEETTTITETPADTANVTDENNSATAFVDGEYTGNSSYTVPSRASHTVALTMKIEGGVVTASEIVFGGDTVDASTNFQKKFTAAYEAEVIGKNINDISLSRVAGASLTSEAFNTAKNQIITQAQS